MKQIEITLIKLRYFAAWLIRRMLRAALAIPTKIHRAFMQQLAEHKGMALFAWTVCTIVTSAVLVLIGLMVGPGDLGFTYAGFLFKWSIFASIAYLVICLLLEQYYKFETEQMATWHKVKE